MIELIVAVKKEIRVDEYTHRESCTSRGTKYAGTKL